MIRPFQPRAMLLSAAFALAIASIGIAARAQEAGPPAPVLPIDTSLRLVEAADRTLVSANCTVCHTVAPILAHDGLTPEQWAAQVEKMRDDYGAQIDDATAQKIVAYLSANYAAPLPSVEDVLLGPARRLEAEAAQAVVVPPDATAFAATIVSGSCAAPGTATWDLGQTAPWGGATPLAPTPGGPVLAANAVLQTKLDRLVLSGSPRALAVRLGAGPEAPLVACGDIVDNAANGRLVVVVEPHGGSGIGGLATLSARAQGFIGIGGEAVETEVLLVRGALVGSAAAAAPSPTAVPAPAPVAALPAVGACADGSTGDCLPVGMRDIFFSPNMLAAPAGGKIDLTVVNQGAIGHNFSIDDRGNPDLANLGVSVDLQPGGTRTVSVAAPAGDYYFYCDIPGHEEAGMRGYFSVAAGGPLSATEAAGTPPQR